MSALIEYLLNDPLTPNLKKTIEVPLFAETPHFFVQGFKGQAISALQKQAAQVYACLCTTINMVKSVYKKPLHWAATEALIANPRAGRGLNAFYDRAGLSFFFDEHPITKKMIFTAHSVNVVAHEMGHAILDAIRPDLWNVQSLEIFAFHESFGDIISMLCTLQYDEVLNYVLQETNNNLQQSNIVSSIAEEMGDFLYATGKRNVEPHALRNALNSFTYVSSDSLPIISNDLSLSKEPHNFSRLFTGSWYDCFVAIYEYELTKQSPFEALKAARDMLLDITINSLPLIAVHPQFYTAVAKAMLTVSQEKYGNYYFSLLRRVFLKRKIINGLLQTSRKKFNWKKATHICKNEKNFAIRCGAVQESHLNLTVEIPSEGQYLVNKDNLIIDLLEENHEEAEKEAEKSLSFLQQTAQIGTEYSDTGFYVVNDKLCRRRTCLDTCYTHNL